MNTTQRSVKKVTILLTAAVLLLGASLVTAAYKSRRPTVETFNQGVSIFDDFLTVNSGGVGEYLGLYFRSLIDGTGYISTGSSETYPGYVIMNTEAVGDKAVIRFANTLYLGNSSLTAVETRFTTNIPGTPTGQETEVYFGLVTVTGGALSTLSNGVVFTYDRAVSNNFRIWHKQGGVVTQETLDYPVEASTDYYLKLLIAGDRALFFINNVLVGDLDVTIAGTTPLSPIWYTERHTGSMALHTLTTDAIGVYQQYIEPRIFSNTNVTQ
jgi:hypothetical protein